MKRFILISLIISILSNMSFAQFDQSPYTYEKHLIINSLAAQTGDNMYGLSLNISKIYPYAGLWTSFFINNNLGITLNTFDNYLPSYFNMNQTNIGGFYRNNKKNFAFGLNLQANTTYLMASDQLYLDLNFSPSFAYFTKKFTFAAQLSYLPLYSNDTTLTLLNRLIEKSSLILYSDVRLSNLIESYSFQPSVLLGINYSYTALSLGFNTLMFKNLLLGLGTFTDIYYSGPALYFYPWIQGGLKLKDNYYFYLKLHAQLYTLSTINLSNFNLLFSFKYHITKHENSVPRYF